MEANALAAQAELIRAVRERRLAQGIFCPHCESERVIRWGRFAGRQRYRCRSCRKCFSDLTGTALRYIKRLDAWPAYFRCLGESVTVREAARASDVAPSTSFRWRHRILSAIREDDCTTLTGTVEFAQTCLGYSEKGPRRRRPDQWRGRNYVSEDWIWVRQGWVLIVARDRNGGTLVDLFGTRSVTGEQLCAAFDQVLDGSVILLCNTGRLGPYSRLTNTPAGAGRRIIKVPAGGPPLYGVEHNFNARNWITRLRTWLKPFRGVATRYVLNYAIWRRTLDGAGFGLWLGAIFPCDCVSKRQQVLTTLPQDGAAE